MSASNMARGALAGALVIGFIASLVITPTPPATVLILSAPGILSGVMFAVPDPFFDWLGAGVLVFGPRIVESMLLRSGTEVMWYLPALATVAFSIITHFAIKFLIERRHTAIES